MAAYDLATLAELKEYLGGKGGSAKDSALRAALTRASRETEQACGRRLVYRAPPEVVGSANVLASTAFAAGAIGGFSQPNVNGRTLIVTFAAGITAGVLTVTGTVAGATLARDFDAANGSVQHGLDFFTAIASMSGAGVTGSGAVKVGSSLGYVEYHTMPCGDVDRTTFRTLERPFGQVLAVYEDPYRLYGSDTLLVVNTDYRLATGTGIAERLSSGVSYSWRPGTRAIKVVYSGGYFTAANVPLELKGHALNLAAQYYNEAQAGRVEIASGSGAMGSWTRFGAAGMTKAGYMALWSSGNVRVETDITGERDFDLEAA